MELTKLRNEEIVREAMANHDKHYWALVQGLKRKRKNAHDLAKMIGEGSTVALAIWNKYIGFDFTKTAGSGAAVSASPNENPLQDIFESAVKGFYRQPVEITRTMCSADIGKVTTADLTLPASPGPRPVCPGKEMLKAIAEDGLLVTWDKDYRFSFSQVVRLMAEFVIEHPWADAAPARHPACPKCGSCKLALYSSSVKKCYVECKNPECEFDLAPETIADFAQFFPASLNGEKRTPEIDMPQLIAQEILDDAFKPGGCCYRLNFTTMKAIISKHWAATTQGTPEGVEPK